MLTRREFFKTSAIGAAALALGAGVGRWSAPAAPRSLALEAWLPADPALAARLLAALPVAVAGCDGPAGLRAALDGVLSAGGATLRVEEAAAPLADFALFEGGRLLDPVLDWTPAWRALRAGLAGRAAAWRLSLAPGAGVATALALTRWDGRREEIALAGDGPLEVLGRGGRPWKLAVSDGELRVLEASCRQGLCRGQGAIRLPGQRLCCAPAGWTAELIA